MAKQTKNNKTKYDWADLKAEFFISDYWEIKSFFEMKFKRFTSYMSLRTKGWVKEKRVWKQGQMDRALKAIAHDRTKFAYGLMHKVLVALSQAVEQVNSGGRVNTDKLNSIYRMVKTECGEPSNITKQESTHDFGDLEGAQDSINDKIDEHTNKKSSVKKKGKDSIRKPQAKKEPNAK